MLDLVTLMRDIAKAIKEKTGTDGRINAQDFPQKIKDIQTGMNNNQHIVVTKNSVVSEYFVLNQVEENGLLQKKEAFLDWSRKIIFNSPYVDYNGEDYIMGQEISITLPFILWKNCELKDFSVYQNEEKLSNVQYNYYFKNGYYCLDIYLSEISYDTTIEINVNYTEMPIEPDKN